MNSRPLPCPGPVSRRGFMRLGLTGFAALSWPGLLRLRAENAAKPAGERTAVILVWLRGGCSHLDTYDPKPNIGSEYRGPFKPIRTSVPGTQLTELLPLQAKLADKFTLVRSMTHTGGGHPAGSLQMLTGDPDPRDKPKPVFPDWMTVANYLRAKEHPRQNPLPNYVGVNPVSTYDGFGIAGSAYINSAYSPLAITGDPSLPNFEVPNITLSNPAQADRLSERVALRQSLDRLERSIDTAGEMDALDKFEAQAMTLLTSPTTRHAFDLNAEDARTRDRYGRHRWGQQLLLARRLVESGVEIVTSTLDGPQCGRVANWDDHAVNHHVFEALRFRAGPFDQAVSALIEDVHARGLHKRVLVVVSGEFGRTPKIEFQPSSGPGEASAAAGVTQPGRDHWPRAFSNLWSGGNIQEGGVIGATDARGEDVIERPFGPNDFLATIYQHLGINWSEAFIKDFTGRPTPIVNNGRPIPELVG